MFNAMWGSDNNKIKNDEVKVVLENIYYNIC